MVFGSSTKQVEYTQREFYFGNHDLNFSFNFQKNFIRTARYNVLDFFPKALILQFKRYANIYFLIIAVLQSISIISPLNPFSAVAPFLFVLGLSMVREGLEDLTRHRSDRESNSSKCVAYLDGQFLEYEWHKLQVGDIVLVKDMEIIPADIIAIATGNENGACFIETSSLDGEKNLKPKGAPKETWHLYNHQKKVVRLEGKISCIPPNPMLSSFDGTLMIHGNQRVIMNSKQLLLRGSRLKNTEWVLGIVAYTGGDTKIMRNSEASKNKQSQIERTTNKLILGILAFQFAVCFVAAIGSFVFNIVKLPSHKIYLSAEYGSAIEAFIAFWSYFLLNNTMIPISLIVSLEFVKLIQAYFIQKDEDIYNKENGKHATVFTSAINEELGQVEYIFSDKTGTLTRNKMEFKIAVIGDELYGDQEILNSNQNPEERPESKLKRTISFTDNKNGIDFSFVDKRLEKLLANREGDKQINFEMRTADQTKKTFEAAKQSDLVREFFMLLATCHECLVESHDDGSKTYQGPSPDEITLVDAASRVGFKCLEATQNHRKIEFMNSKTNLEILHTFEFNSDRKRMTVILRDNQNRIKLYTKGADTIIKARLSFKAQQPYLKGLEKNLEAFSVKGLRTLLVAMRVLSDQEYSDFLKKYVGIANSDNKEKEIAARVEYLDRLADEIERDLYLIGATAVEDRLQDNVPETIFDLIQANIKVWMLTGDKLETAENIAKSCNLIQSHFQVLRCSEKSKQAVQDVLVKSRKYYDYFVENGIKKAMIVEGESLGIILNDEILKALFLSITKGCEAVVCCRVTPKQKADVVRLVKRGLGKITLAIGDGANDVNMIQEAHIGVGIYGQEGMRAVQSSDFALPEFQGLWRLLFVHGRWSYIRISEMILYFFYKNMIFTIPQFYFAFVCAFSAQSVFDDFYITLYNLVFTAFPLLFRAGFEQDVNYKVLSDQEDGTIKIRPLIKKHFPKLYYIGQKNKLFTSKKFVKSIIQGLIHGVLLFLVTYFILQKATLANEGKTGDFWYFSITLYTSVIFVVDMKIAMQTRYWTILTISALIFTSLGLYLAYIWLANAVSSLLLFQTALVMFSSCDFYLIVILNVGVIFIFDNVYFYFKARYHASLVDYFRGIIKQGKANFSSSFGFLNEEQRKNEDKIDQNNERNKEIIIQQPIQRRQRSPSDQNKDSASSKLVNIAEDKSKVNLELMGMSNMQSLSMNDSGRSFQIPESAKKSPGMY